MGEGSFLSGELREGQTGGSWWTCKEGSGRAGLGVMVGVIV